MVAIVSGYSLGLNLTSLGTIGERGVLGNANLGRSSEQVYVNVATGNLVFRNIDDQLAGVGSMFGSTRVYNSLAGGAHAQAWSIGAALKKVRLEGPLNTAGSAIYRTDEDGSEESYHYDASKGLYVNLGAPSTRSSLAMEVSTGQYLWRDGKSGQTERYEGSGAGRILTSTDISGNTRSFAYGANGKLISVTDAGGGTTFYDYAGENLAQIRTATREDGVEIIQTRVRYSYDALGRLSAVVVDLSPQDNSIADGKVFQTFYIYDGSSDRIATVSQSDGTQLSFQYTQVGGSYRVSHFTDALGRLTRYGYDPSRNSAYVVDPENVHTYVDYDDRGAITSVRTPGQGSAPDSTTKYTYDASGKLATIVEPGERVLYLDYDANGNPGGWIDSNGMGMSRTFDSANRVLTETVYTQSQTSSASLGGPLVTRNAYDAAGHLRFQLSPAGNVTEYRYNARGERISTLTYAGDVHPLTGFDATNAPSEAQMVAWAAAANLQRVGRVDAVYDYRGMLQQTVAYAEVNDVGDGVLDDKQVLTRYVYDQAGRLLHTLSPTGGSTTYSYDGLGRVLSVQDAQGNVSLTQYDDVGNRVVLTQANGLKSISTYDKAGQRVSLVMQDAAGNNLGETRYAYDKNDRLIMTTDPGGGRTFMLYDTQGRKVGDVDAGGALKQYVYNGAGQVWRTITYMNTVDPDSLVDARGNPLNPSIDRLLPDSGGSTTVWNLYDGAGRLAKSIDEANALTEYRYDGVGRLVSETKYAQRMTAWNVVQPSRPEHAVVTPSAGDATTYRFYTADGKLRGTVDPEGAVVEYIYDGSGRQVRQIAYATRSTATVTAATSFENIRPVTADADIDEYSIYNNLGRLVGTIDAEGYLTERVYDASGNLTTRIRYATSLNGAKNAVRMALAFTPDLVRVRPASSPQDSVWTYTYTRLNQVSSERDAEGTQTLYVYDEMGRLTSTVKAAGTPSSRSLLSRYDAQGHLTGELSGEGAAKLDGNQTQAEIDAIWKAYGTTYTYDVAGRRTSMTDGAGQRTLYYFDANGRVTHTINALGYVQERVYDNTGQLVETIRYGAPVWLEGLNGGLADGMLEWVLTAASDAEVDIHATYAYTQDRRLARESDGAGGVIEHHYDAFGNEIERLTRIDGAINRTDRMAYDRLGRLTQSTDDALGYARKNTREYDAFGRVITTRDGAGNTVNHQYDRLGREVLTYDYLGEKSVAYDAIGNVLSSIDELGRRTSYAYDAQQRSVTVTTPDGVAVTTVHNAFGQTVEVRDGNGNVNRHVYNADGSLVRTEAGGTVTTQAYDCLNRLTETVDGRGVKTIYTYDAVGQRLSRTVDPEGLNLSTRYYYDAYGRQYHVVEPGGGQTAMTFDEAGRVLSLTVDAARLKLITRYTYDSAGQRLTVTAPNGVVTAYTYDSLGRRDSETVDPTGLALTTRYTYDLNDNLIARTDPDGGRTQYAFDSRGRVVFKVDPAGGVVETRYDAAGQISAEIAYAVPLGQAPGGGPYSEAQLRAMLVRHAADAVEYRYYDGNGRLAMTVGGAGNVVEMRYDGNGNLVERIAYANRLPMTRVGTIERPDAPPASPIYDQRQRMIYDALNRAVLQVDGLGGVVRQRFDANGNVLERVAYAGPIPLNTAMTEAAVEAALATVADPRQDRREANVYDRAGRLTHTMDGVGAVTRNIYDAAGNRVRQILYATPLDLGADPRNVRGSSGDRFSDWIYDGVGRLIASVDPTGAVTRRVLDANGNAVQVISHAMRIGADVPRTATAILAAVRHSPLDRVTTTAFDAVGRAVLVIDAEQGVVRNTYDAAGNLLEAYHFSMPLRGPDLASAAPASLTLAALTARLPPIDGQGRSSRGVYGANGRPTYKIDAAGFVTQFSYDARGNMTRVRRYAHGVSLAGAAPNVSEVQAALLVDEARDRVDRFAYDPQGRLLRATDSLGNSESYAYDGVGNKIRFINKAGDQWTYEYDAAGRLLVERSPQTNIVETRWSEAGDLTVGEAKRISVVTRNVYDGLGNLVSRTEADGQPQARTTRYGYDAAGRQIRTVFAPVKVYDAASDSLLTNGASGSAARREGAATSLTSDVLYNAFGEAVAGRDVAGAVSYKVYDKTGALKYDVDAEGYVTEYERNALGDVTQRLRYANKTTLTDHGYGGISAEAVAAAVNAAGLDQGADRGVVTRYDRLGRAIETSQSQIFAYDSSAAAGSQYFTSNKLIRTEYDAFGQVSAVRELVNPVSPIWATTMQYYDKVGNMTGRVDALGYVTTMSYDGMGNKTSVREYATATTGWNAQGYGLPRAHADDRLTTYAFDVLGRKVAETRVNVEYSKQSNGTVQRGDLKTTFGYDALGNQTYVRDPAGGCTYSYYDALGRITATVEPRRTDALGMTFAPLTTFHRDALGNTVLTLQHANGATSAMASGYTAGAASGQDRYNYAGYDSRGNKIQTIDANGARANYSYNAAGLLAKQWRGVTGNDGGVKTWFQAFEYDKLGRQIRVIDPASTAVASNGVQIRWSSSAKEFRWREKYVMTGENAIDLNWSSLIDADGGLVRVQVYYNTVSTRYVAQMGGGWDEWDGWDEDDADAYASGAGIAFGSASVATSRTLDVSAASAASGVVFRWRDDHVAQGGIAALSHIRVWQQDAAGNWISRWEGSEAQANGPGVFEISQQQAGWSDTVVEYNAFGEVVRRGPQGALQESYEYDNAGNVVRSRGADGVDRITLYNLQGQATASMASGGAGGGNVDVATIGSVQLAAGMGGLRREDTVYDLLGNAVMTLAPERSVHEGGVTVTRNVTLARVEATAALDFRYGPGDDDDDDVAGWYGTNRVRLGWSDLGGLGDGDVLVVMGYLTAGGVSASITRHYESGVAASGVTVSWDDSGGDDGGVSRVTGMRVYKKDTYGNWKSVIDQQGVFGNAGSAIDIAAPVDPGVSLRLELRRDGGDWHEVGLANFGKSLRYDAASLSVGRYEYRVSQIDRAGIVKSRGSGTLTLDAPDLATIGSAMGFGSVGNDIFSWASFGAGVDAQFRFRATSGGQWVSLPVAARGSGQDGVDWSALGAGAYEYELLLVDRTSGVPYAHATGVIDKAGAIAPHWEPPVGIAPITQNLLLDPANTGVRWTTPDRRDFGGSAVLRYRQQGSEAWQVVPLQKRLLGDWLRPGLGVPVTMTYWADLGTLPAGNYEFDLLYAPAGASEPSKHRVGVITQGAATPGHYETRTYTVSVPGPRIRRGLRSRIQYHTETRTEQVWVAAATPRPGMTQSAAPYVAGYTAPGRPARYALTRTTEAHSKATSIAMAGQLGTIGAWSAAGPNGGVQSSRPVIQRAYDRWGNVLSITDPRCPYWVTRYSYNASNQVTSEIRPTADGAAGAGPATHLYYDAQGNNVAIRDANGNVNGIQYDAGGNRIVELHADGGVYRYGYNAFGEKRAWVDALGNATTYTYDNVGRLTRTAGAAVATYAMSGGATLVATGTRTVTENVRYDELGNVLSLANGAGETVYYRYDLRGNLVGVRKPGQSVELRSAFDTGGRKVFEVDGNGNAASWAYDDRGRLIGHMDIGGARYAYRYDHAGQLLQQTNTRGQDLRYTYDAAGQVTRIHDYAQGKFTDYAYDHAGNRVRERMEQGGSVYQNNRMAYDALGRLREVSDGYFRQNTDYDGNGNRTRVETQYTDASETWRSRIDWYGYDAMNRLTTAEAANAGLEITAAQGHKLTYDANGNRLSDRHWDKVIHADGSTAAGFTTETYGYDALNRLVTTRRDGVLLDTRYYDGADRVVLSGIDGALGKAFFDRSGLAGEQHRHVYDETGRLASTRVLKMTANGLSGGYATTYLGYDATGNVTQYRVDVYEGRPYTNTYAYDYARYEGYREAALSGTSSALNAGQTTYQYDVNGDLAGVTDSKNSARNQTLIVDAHGKVLRREQNGKTTRSLVVNGQLLGAAGPTVGEDDFSQGFRPISGDNPSGSPGTYRVQAGDTLQGIAQHAYGDSRLWYLIAEANGLASDRDLRVGVTVTVPNRAAGSHNDYRTFKPYDPGKLLGDTQPSMPAPQAHGGGGHHGGCGGVGKILVAVVAIVAVVYTAGALAPAAAGAGAGAGAAAGAGAGAAAGTAAGAGAAAGFGATMTTGAAVLTGTATGISGMTAVGIGLAAGAVGSVVSQGVGMAIGAQSRFSWSGVALSALGAGVSAGVGTAANGGSLFAVSQAAPSSASLTAMQIAQRAMVSSTFSQAIAVAAGLQSRFSWTSVAASGIGAGVGAKVGAEWFPHAQDFGDRLARGFVSGAVGGITASVLTGGKADTVRIATDAFGNALGNSIVEQAQLAAQRGWEKNGVRLRGLRVQESDLRAWGRQDALRRPMPTAGDGIYEALVAEFGRAQREGALSLEGGAMVAGPAMLSGKPLNREDPGTSSDMPLRGVADPARNRELENTLFCEIPPVVGSEKWLKTATSAELYANGYQTMEQYDPARDLRSAQAQMKFANDLGFAIAGPQVAAVAGMGIYAAGSGFIASQLAKTPAATLGYRQLLKGMGSGGVASTAAYLVLKQEDATPAGVAVAFAGGAIGGGLVKQGLNYFAQLPNTAIPLTGSNFMTQFTGAAYGFGTVNWANTFGITSAGQSWWTRPIYSPVKGGK